MAAILEQLERLSVAEKMQLMECILKSVSRTVAEQQVYAPKMSLLDYLRSAQVDDDELVLTRDPNDVPRSVVL